MDKSNSAPRKRRLNRMNGFWRSAYLAAELSALVRHGTKINPKGLAHLAAEFADASLEEYRKRYP